MTNSAKLKGDRAEREVQALLRDHLGVPARRMLGAGRKDDLGDVSGVPDTTIQVASYADIGRAIREKLPETVAQQERAGSLFGALFCRRRGGGYIVVMTVEQFATLFREAQPVPYSFGCRVDESAGLKDEAEWERHYDEAMQSRDWQTCDQLLDERAQSDWYTANDRVDESGGLND